jgi:hypothetical protein
VDERRKDSRRDTTFSLRNLLKVRSERFDYSLAVLGTPDGLVMVGSREDELAKMTAAQVSLRLFKKSEEAPFGRFTRSGPGRRVSGIRFDIDGNEVFLAVVDEGGRRDEREDDVVLDELAERIQDIIAQQRRRLAA